MSKTIEEIQVDKKFLKWFSKNGYHVSYSNKHIPVYWNKNDSPGTKDNITGDTLGQTCYDLVEIYKIYEKRNNANHAKDNNNLW
jgi:hypothetical protein